MNIGYGAYDGFASLGETDEELAKKSGFQDAALKAKECYLWYTKTLKKLNTDLAAASGDQKGPIEQKIALFKAMDTQTSGQPEAVRQQACFDLRAEIEGTSKPGSKILIFGGIAAVALVAIFLLIK